MPALSLKKLIIICALVTLTGIALLLTLLIPEEVGILQIIICTLILLCWPIGILTNYFLKNRTPKADSSGAMEAPKTSSSLAPSRDYEELARGAEEAVQFLRSGNLGNREVSDPVYSLPWYLLAGPPNSGKTSLALSAGLNFNALSSQRRADQNLVRATRDCDWRVTDNAVIVDTAGRYLTEGQDRDEWLGLLATLKKYRKNRALDGFVLTVNAANILSANEAEIEQQAQVLRARIDEVIKSTGVRFPVYLVFTHSDSIPGFKEFFAAAPPNEQAQVWGATIPLEQSNTAHALFDVEFDYLLDALMRRRITRLSGTTSASEQHGIFNFPLRFAETRRKLGLFTLALFRPNPFSELPLLRGFYFTSNNLGTDGRINGTGTFSEDLFKQVIFRDQDIAASFQSKKAAPNKLAKVKLAVGALAAACALWFGGTVISFFNNNTMLSQAQAHAKRVLDHYEAGRGQKAIKITEAELADLDKLRETLTAIDDTDHHIFGSLLHRFGLYSGGKIRAQVHQVYFDFVAQRFLSPALTKLESELDSVNPSNEDQLDEYYSKLQIYKMLESQERTDPKSLEEKLSKFWDEPRSERGRMENLAFYAEQAALHEDDDATVPRPLADATRVNSARAKLKNYSATKRVYNDIVRRINKLGESIDLAKVLEGQEGSEILEESDPHPVPYAFTKRAYYKHVTGDAMAAVKEDLGGKDDWVMGEKSSAQGVNIDELRARYSSDYAAHWEKFLKGIGMRKFTNKANAVEALGTLSQENSPLKKIVAYVSNETNLSEPPKDSGVLAWLKGILASKTGIRDQKIESAFSPLIKFSATESIARYLSKLGEVRDKLRSAPGNSWNEVATALKENKDFEKSVGDTRDLLKPLDTSPGSKAAAEFLGKPIDIIGAGQKGGDAKNLDDAWKNLVANVRKLESRFPFSNNNTDVQIIELVGIFNPVDGELASLTKKFLSDKVEGTAGQLKAKNPADFSEAAVGYLNQVAKLQAALFPGGSQQPKITYSLVVTPPKNKKVDITADGTKFAADGSMSNFNLTWPSATAETGIKVLVTDKEQALAVGQTAPPSPAVSAPSASSGQGREVANYPGIWGVSKMVAGGKTQFDWSGIGATVQAPGNNPFAVEFSKLRVPDSYK